MDATTLGANAAFRTLQRKDSKASYKEFVEAQTEKSGKKNLTLEELAQFDRKRTGKKL